MFNALHEQSDKYFSGNDGHFPEKKAVERSIFPAPARSGGPAPEGIHAAAQGIAGRPETRIKLGFLDGHCSGVAVNGLLT
ncbi:hypothetical protein [Dechloromonas sp. A34]|uniref:hypothetical protein n=1 Tax=Dechloromonas sp. A34 TaxID=447588 RepID=UPI002248B4E0|nr:hypothetical protein [Dechloromonas sp. A34]